MPNIINTPGNSNQNHLTSTRIVKIKRPTVTGWRGRGEIRELTHGQWKCKYAAALENDLEISEKVKRQLPHDSATPLLGISLMKVKMEHMYTNVHSSITCSNKEVVTTQMSVIGEMNK